MGKTRLSRELALEAHEAGAIVLHGAANEDLLMPHHHVVEALGHLLAVAAPAELRRRVEPRAADLEAGRAQPPERRLRRRGGSAAARRARATGCSRPSPGCSRSWPPTRPSCS